MRLPVCLALAFAILARGQAQTPAPEVKPEDKCIVEGHVINVITGEPVKKAQLLLRRTEVAGSPHAAVSDEGGKFSIADIDPGKYRLSVSRAGFVQQEYGARGNSMAGTTLTIATNDKLTGIVFKLMPQGVIAGRVVDEDGDPMAGVSVQAMQYRYVRGQKGLTPVGAATSNDLGEYRLYGLRPGKSLLMAAYRENFGVPPASGARNPAEPEDGYAPVYYPGALEPSGAAPLTLTPGLQMLNTDIRLIKTRTVRNRGKVIFPQGSDARGAAVVLMPRGGMYYSGRPAAAIRDSQGDFEMRGATPGSYILTVNYNLNGLPYRGHQPVDVGTGNLDNVQITVLPPVEVAGRIRVEGTSQARWTQAHVYLQSVTAGMGGGYATSDAQGNFVLRNLAPDKCEISVNAPAGLYTKSVRFGEQDVTDQELDLSSGVAAGQIEVLLSAAGGHADGSVTNEKGEPSAGATVTLVPEGPRRSSQMFLKTGTSDQNGRFTFKDIAPGDYKIYAWDQIESGAAQDPDFVKPYEDKAKKLRIAENGRENLELKLIQTDPGSQQ
jgi:hypothetical protein